MTYGFSTISRVYTVLTLHMHYYDTSHIAHSYTLWFRCPENIIYAKYTFLVYTNCLESNERAARIHFRELHFRTRVSFRPATKNGRSHAKTISTWSNYLEEQFRRLGSTVDDKRMRHTPDRNAPTILPVSR